MSASNEARRRLIPVSEHCILAAMLAIRRLRRAETLMFSKRP
jgi:hypothetical protein